MRVLTAVIRLRDVISLAGFRSGTFILQDIVAFLFDTHLLSCQLILFRLELLIGFYQAIYGAARTANYGGFSTAGTKQERCANKSNDFVEMNRFVPSYLDAI